VGFRLPSAYMAITPRCSWGYAKFSLCGTGSASDPGMPSPRPFVPATTYYLELDGKPACVSNYHPESRPLWACAYSSRGDAQRAALLVWRDHPHCTIAIRKGPCPRDQALWDYEVWDQE